MWQDFDFLEMVFILMYPVGQAYVYLLIVKRHDMYIGEGNFECRHDFRKCINTVICILAVNTYVS